MSRAARYSMAVATLAFVLFALMPAFEASSQQSKENEITVPPGAKVQIEGSTAMMSRGGLGIEGGWDCSCEQGKTGTCTMSSDKNSITCLKASGDTCTGACQMTTTTSGLTGGPAIATSPGGGGGAGVKKVPRGIIIIPGVVAPQ